MEIKRPIFHLAFPIKDVSQTVSFFRDKLKFQVELIEDKRCIISLGGHQLVAHLSEKDVSEKVSMYPRHFGVIFDKEEDFNTLLKNAKDNGAPFFKEPFARFPGSPREHRSFFLVDPSNNLLEFKWYRNPELIFKPA